MDKITVSVVGVSEVLWKGQGGSVGGDYAVCYCGGRRAQGVVAILVLKSIVRSVVKKCLILIAFPRQ